MVFAILSIKIWKYIKNKKEGGGNLMKFFVDYLCLIILLNFEEIHFLMNDGVH